MKTRWIVGTLMVFAGSCLAVALAGGGPNFDYLSDGDRARLQKRFDKELWPLMLRGEKFGCVGCHNGKINSQLKYSGDSGKDFRMMVKGGFFLLGDSGSILAHITSKDRKKRMPPPGRGEPWTAEEIKVLDLFVKDLDKKQQKRP